MPSLPEDFHHCLSSFLFLLNRDAVIRSYRPEDFGHQPLRKPLLSNAIQQALLEHVGIELSNQP
jgi:hypothetical protein